MRFVIIKRLHCIHAHSACIFFQKHFREIDEMKKAEVALKDELEKKDFLLRRQADTILAQKSEIDRQKYVTTAKTCNIL